MSNGASVFALFSTTGEAGKAIECLVSNGVPHSEISVFMSEDSARSLPLPEIAGEKVQEIPDEDVQRGASDPELAAGALGAVAGGLAGLGVYRSSAMGLAAGGPAVAALAQARNTSAAPDMAGREFLKQLGLDAAEAENASKALKNGEALVVVHDETQAAEATTCLKNSGGRVINAE